MKGSCACLLWRKIFNIFLVFIFLFSQLFVFVPTAKAAPNFSNPTFETDLSGWSPTFSLLDQFNTARSVGSVNGTSAEPTGGIRTVIDTESKLSITGGQASFSGGKATPAHGDPALWYPATTRTTGETLLGDVKLSADTSKALVFGFGSAQSGTFRTASIQFSSTGIFALSPTTAPVVGSFAADTPYTLAITLRGNGYYGFIKGGAFTTWTLLWPHSLDSTQTLYPAFESFSAVSTYDNVRIPTSTFIPTPTAYDTFTTASSTSTETVGPDSQTVTSLPWTGSTWSVSGGSVSNTPTTGAELLTDGGIENWTNSTTPTNWNKNLTGTSTVNQETTTVHGGGSAARLDVDASGSNVNITQTVTTAIGNWVQTDFWARSSAAGKKLRMDLTTNVGVDLDPGTTYTHYFQTRRALATNPAVVLVRGAGSTSGSLYFDDVSSKNITTSSLFRTIDSGSADGLIEAAVTGPNSSSGIQGGLVLNLDSTSNPQNFIIVYLDGKGNIVVDEDVAGTYTNKSSTAITYSDGATLRAVKYGNSLDVYYNNARVGSTLTMTANTNTRMGLFSTSSTNTFDNFAVWPRSGYQVPDFIVSPSTTNTYAGSSGSAKLEAGANSGNFTQSITTGDSRSYTLSAYAYTNGSAVTSSDLVIYGNGRTVPTTYEAAGSGWYKLTGTVSGSTAATDYGVQVQAGKTVYVDNIGLDIVALSGGSAPSCGATQPSSAPTINSSIQNSNSIQLNFSKAGGSVSYYALEYGTQPGIYPYGSTNIGGSSTTSYTVGSLNSGTAYYFRIRAGNDCATGPWSNEVAVTTLGGLSATIPVVETKPVEPILNEIRNLPSPAPAPSPSPSLEPVSFKFPEFKFPTITWPQISFSLPEFSWPTIQIPQISLVLPKFTLPKISFQLPVITIPNIAISLPSVSLPQISIPKVSLPAVAIDLSPIAVSLNSFSRSIGQTASGISIFVKESVSYANYISSQKQASDMQFWGKVGEWITFTGTSFKEIVLDEQPNMITDVQITKVTPTTATVRWKTNHLSTSQVSYGESLDYGHDVTSKEMVHDHVLEIKDLKPGTSYFYEVMSQNGNYVYNAWHEFKTPEQ